MRKAVSLLFAMALVAGPVWAQPDGQVQGLVQMPLGQPAAGADVWLSGVGDGTGHPHHPHLRTRTNLLGQFGFPMVTPGVYTVSAAQPMGGHASSLIEVLPRQMTNVVLTLHRCDSAFTPDSMAVVELAGTAIVVLRIGWRISYFLDVDDDSVPDYRLAFGPPWYEPVSGAERPQNGDAITIVGALLTYGEPPMVIVFEINGLSWRDPRAGGHGGYGGDAAYLYEQCGGHTAASNVGAQVNPLLIDIYGVVELDLCLPPPVNPPGVFMFRPLMSDHHLFLNFGTDWETIPGLGWDPVHIVGGLVAGNGNTEPWVIVYEMDGVFVREPGDTTNLVTASSVDDETPPVPVSHLTAVNYPNPFNAATTIEYSVPAAGFVELKVFDVTGREMGTLVNGRRLAGVHRVVWDGSGAPSGIYLYRLSAGGATAAGRMVLLK